MSIRVGPGLSSLCGGSEPEAEYGLRGPPSGLLMA